MGDRALNREELTMTTFTDLFSGAVALLGGALGRALLLLLLAAVVLVPAVLIGFVRHRVSRVRSRVVEVPGGYAWRREAFHAPNHTWVALRGPAELAVGIDSLAQHLMPSVTGVELPRPGAFVRRGEPVVVLHAGGRSMAVAAPVSGMVVRRNAHAERDPGAVKREPYGEGWLFSVAPADASYRSFPAAADAAAWLERERGRLGRFLEEQLGFAAADGGELVSPPLTLLTREGWEKLVREFMG
jgi:glycine cleavage system H lipoate-binding protein